MSKAQQQAAALMGNTSPAAEGGILMMPFDKYGETATSPVDHSSGFVGIVLLSVLCLHITVFAALYHSAVEVKKFVAPLSISGVLIEISQKNMIETPKITKTQATQPKPAPASSPKPKITPPQAPSAPSDKAIALPEPSIEEKSPQPEITEVPARPSLPPDAVKTEKEKMPESPIVPPRQDASHLNNRAPTYPRTALRLRQTGTVILKLLIRANGTVDEIKVKTSSGHQRLDKAALKAVKRWRYVPAKHGNQTVDFWYEQPIVFSLRQ